MATTRLYVRSVFVGIISPVALTVVEIIAEKPQNRKLEPAKIYYYTVRLAVNQKRYSSRDVFHDNF